MRIAVFANNLTEVSEYYGVIIKRTHKTGRFGRNPDHIVTAYLKEKPSPEETLLEAIFGAYPKTCKYTLNPERLVKAHAIFVNYLNGQGLEILKRLPREISFLVLNEQENKTQDIAQKAHEQGLNVIDYAALEDVVDALDPERK